MANMTFRFTTECEMQLQGESYEEIYLQFKDFIHGEKQIAKQVGVRVYPPESVQVFFDINSSGNLHEIPEFKGSYEQDIKNRCSEAELQIQQTLMPTRAINCFQEDWSVYWH